MQVTEEKTDYTYVLEAAVMAREQVTVPAGTFDAYHIHFEQKALIGPPFKASSRIWYAPELGVPVKRKRLRSTIEAGNPGFELVDYTPAGEA
ncbi:hypothetical protein CKO28_00490 [Rhodovibrio sodomensis]|uniref:DUF3108 domain-containing protein n=1 Tax=Rhodovibrio sodomensis TaxID=1088 RepID=A0ABS1D9V0_9PROT|nr:hypothetical protein [Rhodovibrio sodomensis]MBK1666518.1 hypothetical protein [Rhodovibrio sodomensis]